MTDNITLPRAVALQIREALMVATTPIPADRHTVKAASTALDAALWEPPAKPEPVAWMESPHGAIRANPLYRITAPQSLAWSIPLYAAPPAAAKPEPVHPGYIIGSHWLETAYSRIAAGESEANVLTEVLGARGWAKREPATYEQAQAAHRADCYMEGIYRWHDYHTGWQAAERFHGITKEDKT